MFLFLKDPHVWIPMLYGFQNVSMRVIYNDRSYIQLLENFHIYLHWLTTCTFVNIFDISIQFSLYHLIWVGKYLSSHCKNNSLTGVVLLGICWSLLLVYVMSSLKWQPGDLNAAQHIPQAGEKANIPMARAAKSQVCIFFFILKEYYVCLIWYPYMEVKYVISKCENGRLRILIIYSKWMI